MDPPPVTFSITPRWGCRPSSASRRYRSTPARVLRTALVALALLALACARRAFG
ncbi:hypothetical protein AB2L28_15095 [Kineococcus sp. TBRC 1896]|uniref:Uncharacterized protein n=1 Tax=Kineococcus mangrovi TaxID=1660183 RepID=A0ABV4I4D3_9ACTN